MRRTFIIFLSVLTGVFLINLHASEIQISEVAPGVLKISAGEKDSFNPFDLSFVQPKLEAMSLLPQGELPFAVDDIKIINNDRGCSVIIPLKDGEEIYGFGMQMGSFRQRGLKRRPIVNDYPLNNLGYSHAPQPFYVSTAGYGIIINTARYTTFHCGSNGLKSSDKKFEQDNTIKTSTEDLYRNLPHGSYVFVDIPNVDGIELFVLKGNNIKEVVERYNLFSGGGCLPSLWGLGLKYRVKSDFNDQELLHISDYFRNNNIPCDVLGLEPGWQTRAYSCSYVWSNRFPHPKRTIQTLKDKGYKVNLWEHAYVNSASPIYDALYNYSGNFVVWGGLVPDFTLAETRSIFGEYHKKLLDDGVMGFKLDECDNSNIAHGSATWGFPDMTEFPSGIDGERMHQVFGQLYLKTLNDIFKERNLRTYQDYRASGLFMSSYPAVLYSDTYDLKEYIRMICNTSFGGLLWSPELRESGSDEELFHRLQTALLAPQALINAWYLANPPWLQYDKGRNNESVFLKNAAELEDYARTIINMRMSLVPYLYAAFYAYATQGTPPFRALVLDYPEDKETHSIDDQYMIGKNIMAAPLHGKGNKRKVYFPEGGIWYNFYSHQKYQGGQSYEIETAYDQLPIYVKANSIIPIAAPLQYIGEDYTFDISCQVFGDKPESCILLEDDGVSYNYEQNQFNLINLSVEKGRGKVKRTGNYKTEHYRIKDWIFIK
ncbi:MAG: TIM-barrel domain-containing protein [Paludibacter sp.]|jgi:alpha-D-xyloside xylohydrolase